MNDHLLLSEVARLYYEQDLTQSQIAKRLFISRSSISRLIKQAREEGIVEIVIHYPYDRMRTLEYEFFTRFNISEIRIIDVADHPNPSDYVAVTKLAASYLNSLLNNESILGLTWGRSVFGAVQELRPKRFLPNMQVVQMAGSIESNTPFIDGPDLVRNTAGKYGCKYHYLMVPFSVEDEAIRESLIRRPSVIETLALAENANIMCTGIGSDANWGNYLKPEDLKRILDAGAIGYISGYYFDINGNIIELPEIYNRFICVSRKIFETIPYRIAVISDIKKAKATLGALRGKLINSLIISTVIANKILELDNKYK